MYWKELQEKYRQLQAEGKTDEEATEMLRGEIHAFAKECVEQPGKVVDVMPKLSKAALDDPILSSLLSVLLVSSRNGWGQ